MSDSTGAYFTSDCSRRGAEPQRKNYYFKFLCGSAPLRENSFGTTAGLAELGYFTRRARIFVLLPRIVAFEKSS